jgi:hypothetical protein
VRVSRTVLRGAGGEIPRPTHHPFPEALEYFSSVPGRLQPNSVACELGPGSYSLSRDVPSLRDSPLLNLRLPGTAVPGYRLCPSGTGFASARKYTAIDGFETKVNFLSVPSMIAEQSTRGLDGAHELADYSLAHSARAELCRKLGRMVEARAS